MPPYVVHRPLLSTFVYVGCGTVAGYKSAYSVARMHDTLPSGSTLKCLSVCVCLCVGGCMRADGVWIAPASDGKISCGLVVLPEV